MPPERRRTSYGRWAESRPEGYVCPYRRCGGKRYTQLRHYREHLRRTHANERVPAPEYRAPDAPEDPPPPEGPDNEQSGTAVPFWDWGPSQRHSKSIRLLDGDDLRGLGAGNSLVVHVQALMEHIEATSKPILQSITADSGAIWPPLEAFQTEWAHLRQGENKHTVPQHAKLFRNAHTIT